MFKTFARVKAVNRKLGATKEWMRGTGSVMSHPLPVRLRHLVWQPLNKQSHYVDTITESLSHLSHLPSSASDYPPAPPRRAPPSLPTLTILAPLTWNKLLYIYNLKRKRPIVRHCRHHYTVKDFSTLYNKETHNKGIDTIGEIHFLKNDRRFENILSSIFLCLIIRYRRRHQYKDITGQKR